VRTAKAANGDAITNEVAPEPSDRASFKAAADGFREMTALPLVACALEATDQERRLADWTSLLVKATLSEETADGVRYAFVASEELESRLRTLVAAEKACCAFFEFSIVRTTDEIQLRVWAPPEAAGALRFVFPTG
jgi:hypothetical protein